MSKMKVKKKSHALNKTECQKVEKIKVLNLIVSMQALVMAIIALVS